MRTLKDIDASRVTVVAELPPNIAEIEKVFPGVGKRARWHGIYFCYGNTIYNPRGLPIDVQLLAHEATHCAQQIAVGADEWWRKYLADPQFRFDQELEAHRVEFEAYRHYVNDSRPFRRRYLAAISERLSGPLYGRMVTKAEAKQAILGDR
jgi:hypothetical protein